MDPPLELAEKKLIQMAPNQNPEGRHGGGMRTASRQPPWAFSLAGLLGLFISGDSFLRDGDLLRIDDVKTSASLGFFF